MSESDLAFRSGTLSASGTESDILQSAEETIKYSF